jgi:hypothetical protein
MIPITPEMQTAARKMLAATTINASPHAKRGTHIGIYAEDRKVLAKIACGKRKLIDADWWRTIFNKVNAAAVARIERNAERVNTARPPHQAPKARDDMAAYMRRRRKEQAQAAGKDTLAYIKKLILALDDDRRTALAHWIAQKPLR